MPMFTSGNADDTATEGMSSNESGDEMNGDGDPTGGDGDPTGGDGDPGGCETDPNATGASCGEGDANYGSLSLGNVNTDFPIGRIYDTDNGPGNGSEDWYQIAFPADANNPRPTSGTVSISFATNEGNDYRFEVYRDCGAQPYGQGLASDFGASAPPLSEWSFEDIDVGVEQIDYTDNIGWPSQVWIRVFRFQNDQTCSKYQLVAEWQ